MIYQTAMSDPNFEHVGCAFDSLAYAREKLVGVVWTADELESAWVGAQSVGILDSGFNITDWQHLADYLTLPLTFLGKHELNEIIGVDLDTLFIVTEWHNDRTNFSHFVVGQQRPVEWDPIEGGSVTVREGYPVSNRIFQIVR